MVTFIHNSFFLFRTITVVIEGKEYKLKHNSILSLDIPAGDYEVVIKVDYLQKHYSLNVEVGKDSSYSIKQMLPDLYYILGIILFMSITIPSYFLPELHDIKITFIVIFILPILLSVSAFKSKFLKIDRIA